MMLKLEPVKLANGSLLFPDSEVPGRYYLQPVDIRVVRLDFKRQPAPPHRFAAEVEFSPAAHELSADSPGYAGKEIVTIPWQSGPVKLWGHRAGRPVLLSSGFNSGYGKQNSLHRAEPDFMPSRIVLTAWLECLCSAGATIEAAAWDRAPGSLFPLVMDRLDLQVKKTWQERQTITLGQAAIRVVEQLLQQGLLRLELRGAGAGELRHQTIINIARHLVRIAYPETGEPGDLIAAPLRSQRFEPGLPYLPPVLAPPLYYRLPVVKEIGCVPGKCRFKAAPGLDWGQIAALRVCVDADSPQTLQKWGITPWHTVVLTQTRQQHTLAESCQGNFWAEADYKNQPGPLRLPTPLAVDDMVIIDTPPLCRDTLRVSLERDWPLDLFPLEITILDTARHLEPAEGVLRFSTPADGSRLYRGLRWEEPGAEPAGESTAAALLTYSLIDKTRGRIHLRLQWGENRLAVELIPVVDIYAPPTGNLSLSVRVEVGQGEMGPAVHLGEAMVSPGQTAKVIIDGTGGPLWIKTGFYHKDGNLVLQDPWCRVISHRVDIQWPVEKILRFANAADVPAGTELWVAPVTGPPNLAQRIRLDPLGVKVSFLFPGSADDTPGYRIALAGPEEKPPPQENRWHRRQGKKQWITGQFIEQLKQS